MPIVYPSPWLLLLHIGICCVLTVHAVCALSVGQWRLREPMLAVYVLLLGGGLAGALGPLYGYIDPQPAELAINGSGALYILCLWRRRRRRGDGGRRGDRPPTETLP